MSDPIRIPLAAPVGFDCLRIAMQPRAARGFTYIGLMVFLAILALGSAAVLSAGASLQRRMNEEELLFIGAQFAEAFKSYLEATPAGQRNYPAKLEELLRDPRYPGVRRHLRRIYVDPMTGKAEWGLVPAPGGIIGVHSLSPRAPLKIAEFEPAFSVLTGKTSYVDWKFGFVPPGLVVAVPLAGTLTPIAQPAGQKPGTAAPGAAPPPAPAGPPPTAIPGAAQQPAPAAVEPSAR